MIEKLKFIASGVWNFFRPLAIVLLSQVGPVLMEAATSAVTAAASMPIGTTGAQRREMAVGIAQGIIAAKGIEVMGSTINACVELAYTKLKSV